MTSPDATAPPSHSSSHFLSSSSFQNHLRTSGVNQTTSSQSQDPKHVTHHVVKYQRLLSPSSCSGAASAPSLPHQPSFGMRPEQLSSRGEQRLLSTVLPGPDPSSQSSCCHSWREPKTPKLVQAERGRVTADGWVLFILLWEERHLFLAAVNAEEEKASGHVSAYRDKGKNNLSTTQSCSKLHHSRQHQQRTDKAPKQLQHNSRTQSSGYIEKLSASTSP